MPGRLLTTAAALVLAAALALATGGCGTSDDDAEVRRVTDGFYAAVRADDGDRACEFLSADLREQLESQTGQDCDDAVTRLRYDGGDVESSVVYITNAKVDLTTGESMFLSLEPDGWRLSAVACRPSTGKPRDRPFDCEAEA